MVYLEIFIEKMDDGKLKRRKSVRFEEERSGIRGRLDSVRTKIGSKTLNRYWKTVWKHIKVQKN